MIKKLNKVPYLEDVEKIPKNDDEEEEEEDSDEWEYYEEGEWEAE